MAKVKLLISVDDEHLNKMPDVVRRVKKIGLKVESQLDGLGIITGSIEQEKQESVRKTPGVASVEEDKTIQIAPPESDIQ